MSTMLVIVLALAGSARAAPTKDAITTTGDDDWALVPDHCTAKPQICYQATQTVLQTVLQKDVFNCPGRNESTLVQGTCEQYGYGMLIGKDPVFRQAYIYGQHPNVEPTQALERCESRSKHYHVPDKTSALVIVTSHGVLGPENCTTCKATGVASPEFTVPYWIFTDAGVNVTLASIQGGAFPVDSEAKYFTHWDHRFWTDPDAIALTLHSPSISTIDFTQYDMVYMAGGWGAAWDLGTSEVLAKGITAANKAGKVLGSVCHGALGFIQATTEDGDVLVKGRNMSAVSNRQIEELHIAGITPMHPETELEKRGARYFANHGVLTDLDQSLVEVDGRLVTGQNQNSACETAQRMLDQLA